MSAIITNLELPLTARDIQALQDFPKDGIADVLLREAEAARGGGRRDSTCSGLSLGTVEGRRGKRKARGNRKGLGSHGKQGPAPSLVDVPGLEHHDHTDDESDDEQVGDFAGMNPGGMNTKRTRTTNWNSFRPARFGGDDTPTWQAIPPLVLKQMISFHRTHDPTSAFFPPCNEVDDHDRAPFAIQDQTLTPHASPTLIPDVPDNLLAEDHETVHHVLRGNVSSEMSMSSQSAHADTVLSAAADKLALITLRHEKTTGSPGHGMDS